MKTISYAASIAAICCMLPACSKTEYPVESQGNSSSESPGNQTYPEAQPHVVEYHPKIRDLLGSLRDMEGLCKNIIRAYPEGKPVGGDALIGMNQAAMYEAQTAIAKAIVEIDSDSSLAIDSKVAEAINAYKGNIWRVGDSEKMLLQKIQGLENAIVLAGATAAVNRPTQ